MFARHAASLVVVRESAGGPAVLMGVRGAGHRFMPNRLVFPGGAVDKADRGARAATEPRPDVLALLHRNAHPRLARAIVIAAARELEEETGLTLGGPPALDRVEYLCRAVTPPVSPIRFNARFLVAPADALSGALSDSRELHSVRFYPLSELVQQDMVLVTREVLQRLQSWLAMPEALRRARPSLDVFSQRRWRTE